MTSKAREFIAKHPQFWDELDNEDVFNELRALSEERGLDFDLPGELIEENNQTNSRLGQFFTPYTIVDFMVRSTLGSDNVEGLARRENRPIRVLDPAAGTGRFAIGAWKFFRDKDLTWEMTNIEIDPRLFEVLVFNMRIRGIPSLNILGDALAIGVHEDAVKRAIQVHPDGSTEEIDPKEVHEAFKDLIERNASA